MSETIIFQLTWQLLLILVVGFVSGAICKRLGLSMLIGYLVGGVLLGDSVLGQIAHGRAAPSADFFEPLTHLGALLLLFSIGLEFSLDQLKRMRSFFFVGGTAQMTLVAVPVTLIARYATGDWRSAALIGLTVAISSTVLVFKALEDYGQIVTRHGRRAIGILLFQDVAIVPLLLLVPMLTGSPAEPVVVSTPGWFMAMLPWLLLAGESIVFILGVWLLRRFVENHGVPLLSGMRSVELLVMGTLAILVGVCFLAVTLELPAAIGALAAGIILGGNRMRHQIEAVVLPFRETFATIFFVGLGAMLDLRVMIEHPFIALAVLALVVTIKATAATVVLRYLRLSWRAALGMGLGLSQMGELSFMLLTSGERFGVLSNEAYEFLLFGAIGSMILTPLLLKVGMRLARGIVEEAEPHESEKGRPIEHHCQPKAFVIGLGPIGARSMSYLEIQGMDVCLLDLSPINLHAYAQQGFRTVAGDATELEVLKRAEVGDSSCGVISVPDDRIAMQIVRRVRELNNRAIILVRCRYETNVAKIKKAGANVVVSEEREAGGAILRTLAEFHQAQGTRFS